MGETRSVVQSEYGDLYKVTLSYDNSRVNELVVKYFDTIPPAVSIAITRTGFLFAAAEFGNHALYQFQVSSRAAAVGLKSNFTSSSHKEADTMIKLCLAYMSG